ncbi:hypothetical protein [Salinisphaera hydrothermalis]|uniref:Uncharacterized protein n=1 Tax=Salinisphaera hydrothermalis (strain C41B8) TaxID=1304275 RepID=A0A084INF1_SALHC|nr:hypothetical protein [Salinisphaera hydrothermalis]KEZ78235.1 hypothetical protein C41B8_06607 [Salinisphaera hydrothermalis C41B8]
MMSIEMAEDAGHALQGACLALRRGRAMTSIRHGSSDEPVPVLGGEAGLKRRLDYVWLKIISRG